ncbi:MAG: hypothetical protein JNM75_14755 [Rhodospirillales bacterium]|nr:hypothetical protein [Rhodospirillales bacterium]
MNRTILAVATAAALATAVPVAMAEDADKKADDVIPGEISGSVALTSDYVFRGISQTDRDAAIQGSLEYSIDTGIAGASAYAGFWGSNVNFNDGDQAQAEIDALFGFRGDVGDTGLSWDFGGIYYWYPGASSRLDYDYWEIVPKVEYAVNDLVSVSALYAFSPNFFADTGFGHYVQGGVSVTPPLPFAGFDLSLDGTVGYQWIESNSKAGIEDYLNWSIGATVSVKSLDFTVAYTDTNLSHSDCFSNTNVCDGRVVFSVGAKF